MIENSTDTLFGFSTSAAEAASSSHTLSFNTLAALIEESRKNKIEFIESPYIPQGQAVYLDFEKLRKEGCATRERGKRIVYHPKDKDVIFGLTQEGEKQ